MTASSTPASAVKAPEPLVLVVNGDRATRKWIETTLSGSGMRVLSFESAADLMSGFTAQTAACVVLDVALPDASGFELQSKLSQAGASVLFLTRERCISSCVRAIKAGAVDFLTVPCDAFELVRALRNALCEAAAAWAERERQKELCSRFERLTPREREVLAFVSTGMMNKQIADRLDISEVTVQIHRGRVMRKMGTRSVASLVRMCDTLLATGRSSSQPTGAINIAPIARPVPITAPAATSVG